MIATAAVCNGHCCTRPKVCTVVPLHGKKKDGGCTCGDPDCRQLGRHPRTKHGVEDATTERSLIEKRWAEWPHARIGVALGTPSRVLALSSKERPERKACASCSSATKR